MSASRTLHSAPPTCIRTTPGCSRNGQSDTRATVHGLGGVLAGTSRLSGSLSIDSSTDICMYVYGHGLVSVCESWRERQACLRPKIVSTFRRPHSLGPALRSRSSLGLAGRL